MDDYLGDVVYAVWCGGGDPDRVDYDRVSEYRGDGYSAGEAAHELLHRQHQAYEAAREQERAEEEYYLEQMYSDPGPEQEPQYLEQEPE